MIYSHEQLLFDIASQIDTAIEQILDSKQPSRTYHFANIYDYPTAS